MGKKNAEIRLDLSRLAPQKKTTSGNKSMTRTKKTKKNPNPRKRSRKAWDNEELKEELDAPINSEQHSDFRGMDENVIRAKTRCHLHQILSSNHVSPKKRKLNNTNDDELSHLCNEIETKIFEKCKQLINRQYMEHSRNLLFNLKQNKHYNQNY